VSGEHVPPASSTGLPGEMARLTITQEAVRVADPRFVRSSPAASAKQNTSTLPQDAIPARLTSGLCLPEKLQGRDPMLSVKEAVRRGASLGTRLRATPESARRRGVGPNRRCRCRHGSRNPTTTHRGISRRRGPTPKTQSSPSPLGPVDAPGETPSFHAEICGHPSAAVYFDPPQTPVGSWKSPPRPGRERGPVGCRPRGGALGQLKRRV